MQSTLQYLLGLLKKLRLDISDIKDELRAVSRAQEAALEQKRANAVLQEAESQARQAVITRQDSLNERAESRDVERNRRDTARLIVEVFAFFSAALLIWIAWGQWVEMKKTTQEAINATKAAVDATNASKDAVKEMREQNKLTRQQMAGTMAAYVSFHIYVHRPNDVEMYVGVQATNTGQVPAREVTGNINILAVSFPTQERVGRRVTIQIPPEPLRPVRPDGDTTFRKDHAVVDILNKANWDLVSRGEMGIRIEGQFSYEDGFGNTNRKSICQMNMVTSWQSGDRLGKVPARPGSVDRVECSQVDARLARALQLKRLVEDEAKRPPPK